jgi:heme exporter protein A
MTTCAVEPAVDLLPTLDRVARGRLFARCRRDRERHAQRNRAPHHHAVHAIARLRGVTVVLDDHVVLRGVDLSVDTGLTIVRGANGAGKTTLLRAIARLVPLARGDLATSAAPLYLGHRPQLLRGLTARENLEFFLRYRGSRGEGVREIARAGLERWGLGAEIDRPVERLSAGQRRRAALARLDTEPETLALLDEPFAELDADGRALLRERIRDRTRAGGTVLIATHGHEDLDAYARAVVLLDAGRLVPA